VQPALGQLNLHLSKQGLVESDFVSYNATRKIGDLSPINYKMGIN